MPRSAAAQPARQGGRWLAELPEELPHVADQFGEGPDGRVSGEHRHRRRHGRPLLSLAPGAPPAPSLGAHQLFRILESASELTCIAPLLVLASYGFAYIDQERSTGICAGFGDLEQDQPTIKMRSPSLTRVLKVRISCGYLVEKRSDNSS